MTTAVRWMNPDAVLTARVPKAAREPQRIAIRAAGKAIEG
jgi:hypothetical protein